MVKGVGVDIVNMKRIRDNLVPLANRVLSREELEIFGSLENEKRKVEFLAGRFAFKEALFKATRTPLGYDKISLLISEDGSPKYHDDKVKVSISHDGEYAVAFVIVEE